MSFARALVHIHLSSSVLALIAQGSILGDACRICSSTGAWVVKGRSIAGVVAYCAFSYRITWHEFIKVNNEEKAMSLLGRLMALHGLTQTVNDDEQCPQAQDIATKTCAANDMLKM